MIDHSKFRGVFTRRNFNFAAFSFLTAGTVVALTFLAIEVYLGNDITSDFRKSKDDFALFKKKRD